MKVLTGPLAILTMCIAFTSCKKSKSTKSIVLYNQPLDVIKQNINGKWNLIYTRGGICGSCIFPQYFQSTEFTGDRVRTYYKDTLRIDTTILWRKDIGVFTNGDSTFVMNYYDRYGYPNSYVVERIQNDTLILHDYAAGDVVFYHFAKIN